MNRSSLLLVLLTVACTPAPEPVTGLDLGMDVGPMLADSGDDVLLPTDTGTTEDAGTNDAGVVDSGTDMAADSSTGCAAPLGRGVWMYRHTGDPLDSMMHPLGTDLIVGNSTEESFAITRLATEGIDRVYGNYGNSPVSDAPVVRSWNAQLAASGIDSQLLVGEATDTFVGCREILLKQITDRLITFNQGTTNPDERFVALHLDIEPQQYDSPAYPATTSCGLRIPNWEFWDDVTPEQHARYYESLLVTFRAIRGHLDETAGFVGFPIYADVATWVDSPSNFDWAGATTVSNSADWMMQANAILDGVTFMSYERDSASSIDASVVNEEMVWPGLRVAVSAKERPSLSSILTWTGLPEMWMVVEEVENTHCGIRGVDVFNYRYLYE